MKAKVIKVPFDIELAKKIQANEYPGKIITRNEKDVRIICFDAKRNLSIIGLMIDNDGKEYLQCWNDNGNYHNNGKENKNDLILQIPEWIQFKDGDVIYCEYYHWPDDCDRLFAVLNGKISFTSDDIIFNSYVSCNYDSESFIGVVAYNESYENPNFIRLATEEEKLKFINHLKGENPGNVQEIFKQYFSIENDS